MQNNKKEVINIFISETVRGMQDTISLRIGEKEREIDALSDMGEMVEDEMYAAIEMLSEESRILGEIRDDTVENGKYADIRQILFDVLDVEALMKGGVEYIKTMEEEIAIRASVFSTELENLSDFEESEAGDGVHKLHIVLQAKVDILSACIEILREKELLKRLMVPYIEIVPTLHR